jgi:CheY-like chemotaxis protein
VTAFARVEDRVRALGAGFNEHISKPIDPRALVEVAARFVVARGYR